MPHLARIKTDVSDFSQNTLEESIKAELDDDDFLISNQIGTVFTYSNLGYNILSQIIAVKTDTPFDEWIRDTLFEPAGINIDISHSPRLGINDNDASRVSWEEAQYHPPGFDFFQDQFFELYAGAGGWVMSPLHLLKFIATIDGFDYVNDILDDDKIALLDTANTVENLYSVGGGWAVNPSSRWHDGALKWGTRTRMDKKNNGKSGAMFINYNNDGDVDIGGNQVANTLNAILDNDDITWPCWSNNDIIKTFTTTDTSTSSSSASVGVSSVFGASDSSTTSLETQSFGVELIINDRNNLITQHEIRILNTVVETDFESNENGIPVDNDTSPIQATFISPQQRRNPVAVISDFELCRSDTILCNLDTMECWDGSLVDRDPNNDCEFFECPDINLIGEILCASDRLQCDDGTIVVRNASLGCAFNECPPCDDDSITNERTAVGRRLLNQNIRF